MTITAVWNAKQARRKLQSTLIFFVLVLSVPIVALLYWSHRQLEEESFLALRLESERLVDAIEHQIATLLAPEELRPFDEYSFFSVTQNELLPEKGIRYSPLAQIPKNNPIAGLIGYFQINPDQTFKTPLLPEVHNVQEEMNSFGIGKDELQKREQLQSTLSAIVNSAPRGVSQDNKLFAGKGIGRSDSLRSRDIAAFEGFDEQFSEAKQQRQVSDLNINDLLLKRSQGAQSGKSEIEKNSSENARFDQSFRKEIERVPRKEVLSLPEQAKAPIQDSRHDKAKASQELRQSEESELSSLAKKIVTFEGEVDPLRLSVTSDAKLLFYRRVWRDKARYLQGFVVESDPFFREILQTPFERALSRNASIFRLAYKGGVLRQWGAIPGEGEREELLYKRALHPPFDKFEVILSVTNLPVGAGELIVTALSVIIIVVLLGGVILVYRVSSVQIELSEKKSDFVSAVTHELKTPLTSIRMYAEMLKSGWVRDKEKEHSYYDFILSESERLSRLIGNVLHLAGVGSATISLTLVHRTSKDVLSLIENKVRSQVEHSGFKLNIIVPEEVSKSTIEIDEDAIVRIFINLIDNALKFSKEAALKEIDLGMREGGNNVEFYVRDYGPGIPAAQQKKIFELFYRAESELTRTTPGTGIGLALVKELASRMKATVNVMNKEPGVEFRIRVVCAR